jgi:hypothetical protein
MLRCVVLVRTEFGGTYRLQHQGDKNRRLFLRRVLRLLVTANGVPSLPIRVTLMMEAIRSSETSFLTEATRSNISEDGTVYVFRVSCFAC